MKRAQMTVFIIIGLVILILIGLLSYVFSSREASTLTPEARRTEAMAEVSARVESHIENCVRQSIAPLAWRMAALGGTLSPRLEGGGIYSPSRDKVDIWGTETRDRGVLNKARTRQAVGFEMADKLKSTEWGLPACLNSLPNVIPGSTMRPLGGIGVSVQVDPLSLVVRLQYEFELELGGNKNTYRDFVADVRIPMGRMIQIGTDIMNEEVTKGQFDTTDYLLKNGADVLIQKYRPYPETVYNITTRVAGYSEPFTLYFAINGLETYNKQARKFSAPLGRCITPDTDCRANIEETLCTVDSGRYESGRCEQVAKPQVTGCCVIYDQSCTFARGAQDCNGTYFDGDLTCSIQQAKGACQNLWCNDLAYYYDDYYGSMRHGESWCTMDTVTGFGTDFVGNRHYLHNCIAGIEYTEPCRDYREERCVSEINPSTKLSQGTCKINRWYDCAAQHAKGTCEDLTKRDCTWLPNLGGSITKKVAVQCVPFVPPGFRFWLRENAAQCSQINSGVDKKYPKTQSFNAIHICSRLGDCGDKRNIVGYLSKGNVYHPKGRPKASHYWAYALYNFHNPIGTAANNAAAYFRLYRKERFISAWLGKVTYEQEIDISPGGDPPSSVKGGSIRCSPWTAASNANYCEVCNLDPLRPCSEYRCKSLGSTCRWIVNRGVGVCKSPAGSDVDVNGPVVSLETSSVRGFVAQPVTSSAGLSRYQLSPAASGDTLVEFDVMTNEPSTCRASSTPSGVDLSGAEPPTPVDEALVIGDEEDEIEVWDPKEFIASELVEIMSFSTRLEDAPRTLHHVAIVTPPDLMLLPAFVMLNSSTMNLTIYVACEDAYGNPSSNELGVTIGLAPINATDLALPQIIVANVSNSTGNPRLFVALNEGVEQCRVGDESQSFDEMELLEGCVPTPLDLYYEPGAPLGSHTCDVEDPGAEAISCKDLGGNIGLTVVIAREQQMDLTMQ